jgi:hypothetical protein
MDKELDGIKPETLENTVVNTVHIASKEEAAAAMNEEKEKKEDYYVDPLEQEKLMKEKLQRMEEERKKNQTEDATSTDDEMTVRPDMNVSGYFSAGNTAKKAGFMSQNATIGTLNFCLIFGIIDAIYSAFYLLALITQRFDVNWFLGWLYAVVVVLSVIITVNGIRSLNIQKDNLKRKAMIGIVGSAISIIPLIAWIIHWFVATFLS